MKLGACFLALGLASCAASDYRVSGINPTAPPGCEAPGASWGTSRCDTQPILGGGPGIALSPAQQAYLDYLAAGHEGPQRYSGEFLERALGASPQFTHSYGR